MRFRNYQIEFVYKGDKVSPFDKRNMNNHLVRIEDKNNGKFVYLDYWHPHGRVDTEKEEAFALLRMAQTALIGATHASVFEHVAGTDDPTVYLLCKNHADKMEAVMPDVAGVIRYLKQEGVS